MKMCKEMIKLRKGLDERGIVWIDASETYYCPYCGARMDGDVNE